MKKSEFYKKLKGKKLADELEREVLMPLREKDEEEKRVASELLQNGTNDYEKMKGAIRVGYSHFLSSLRSAELKGYETHPTFNVYMQHWLYYMKSSLIDSQWDTLSKQYPQPEKLHQSFPKSSNWYDF
jgi:hypothetical protein